MCLNIVSGPHVAKKDFYVVKILEQITKTSGYSPYQYYKYNFKEKVTTEIRVLKGKVSEGLHALVIDNVMDSGWVLHCVDYDLGYAVLGSGLVLCKIPKGATYYLGNNKDIVSNELIPLEPVMTMRDDGVIKDGVVEKLTFKEAVGNTEKYLKTTSYNLKPS